MSRVKANRKSVRNLKPGDGIRWKKHGVSMGGRIVTLERDSQLTHVTFDTDLRAWCFSNDDSLETF